MVLAIAMTQIEPTASIGTGPVRTCIATGEQGAPVRMIRFVVGPQGDVVPDLARRLPGRGMWVRAERAAIEHAVAKNLFAKSAKAAVRPAADLPEGSSASCSSGRWPISVGRAEPDGRWRAS